MRPFSDLGQCLEKRNGSTPWCPARAAGGDCVGGHCGLSFSNLDVQGPLAFLTDDWDGGLIVMDVVPDWPVVVGRYGNDGGRYGTIEAVGPVVFWISPSHGFKALDVTNPAQPHIVAEWALASDLLRIEDGYAYAVTVVDDFSVVYYYIHAVDVRDPLAPQYGGGWFSAFYEINDVTAEDGVVYVATVYDLQIQSANWQYFVAGGWFVSVDVRNHLLLASQRLIDQVVIYDITNPAAPTQLGTYALPQASYLVRAGTNRAYVVTDQLLILDTTDPTTPTLAGVYAADVEDLVVMGNRLFLVVDGALRVLDVSNPGAPVLLASYQPSCAAHHLAVTEDRIYLAGDCLTVLHWQEGAAPFFSWVAEAEDGTRSGSLAVHTGQGASACRYVSDTTANSGSTLSLPVNVPANGLYYLWARVMGLAWDQNSFSGHV